MHRLLRISFGILLCLFLEPAIVLSAGREEIVREEIGAYGDYRFVMERRVVHYDDEPNELLKTERLEAVLIVYSDGKEIYRSEEGSWFYYNDHNPEIGTDITGDGSPDAVLLDDSGGAHCCDTYYIIELRNPLNVITFGLGDGGIAFKDLDNVPGLELDIRDGNFAYWKTSFTGSAFPHLILRYQDGRYVFDSDLTRKPPLSESEFHRISSELRNGRWHPDYFPRDFLQVTVDLIFTGNLLQALQFIEAAWPPSKSGKDDFIAELFQCRLREDRWWPEIARMNNLPPEKPLDDCYKRFGD